MSSQAPKKRHNKLAIAAQVALIAVSWGPAFFSLGLWHMTVPAMGFFIPGKALSTILMFVGMLLFLTTLFVASPERPEEIPNRGPALFIVVSAVVSLLIGIALYRIAIPYGL